jgi:hypothetical protein
VKNLNSPGRIFLLILLTTARLSGQYEASADLKNAVIIRKFDQPVNFDGIPDEKAWEEITPMSMVMHSPVYGRDPTEITDARIGYDDKYLYIGARLGYRDLIHMSSASLKRDYLGMGGDWFGIILDTYNDKENALAFFTSPDGLRFDASIQKDGVVAMPDQMPMNTTWNTFWDVITNKGKEGWSAEIRIPFSSLRFQDKNGEVRMGLILNRWMPSWNETDLYPAIPPNWGQTSFMKPSQAQEVILHGVKASKPLYLAPYLLTGLESINELNSTASAYDRTDKPKFEPGLDIKYGLANNMILDVTVNTDFAQVEMDDQQVNLTRFDLYLPEKRMFFLEQAGIFDFSFGGYSNLFYSRRIGLSDDGDPVRIYGGARMTGRVGRWEMGFLDMQTGPLNLRNSAGVEEEVLPSENFGVLRFRRQVINESSFVGSMFTSRIGVNGKYNLAYGLDGLFRIFGDDYIDLKWSQTYENGVSNITTDEHTRIAARWERRSRKGLGYYLGYSRSGIHYNPGIGFEMMDDFSSVRANLRYGWIPGEEKKLYSHSPEMRFMIMNYIDDGSLMSLNFEPGWNFTTKGQWEGHFGVAYNKEHVRDSLELLEDELYINPGDYEFVNFTGMIMTPPSKPFYLMIMNHTGPFFDGNRFSLRLEPVWNISKHFELGAVTSFNWLEFKERDLSETSQILGGKIVFMLNTAFSLSSYIQYNTSVNEVMTNLRFRYNPREGNDLYIVFNEGRNTDPDREIPRLPVYSVRSLFLKYTYTFSL